MNSLLNPAMLLANCLSFTQKFSLLFLLFLVPLLLVLGQLYGDATVTIVHSEQANRGQQLILALKPIAINMAKHRGNSSQHLNGAEGKTAVIERLEGELDDAFKRYARTLQQLRFNTPKLGLANIEGQWKRLILSNASSDPKVNFQAHSELIAQVLGRLRDVANETEVVLASSIVDFYLMDAVAFSIPRLQEALGQLRGKAAGAIADTELSLSEQVAISALLSRAKEASNLLQEGQQQLFLDENLRALLKPEADDFSQLMGNFITLIERDLQQGGGDGQCRSVICVRHRGNYTVGGTQQR